MQYLIYSSKIGEAGTNLRATHLIPSKLKIITKYSTHLDVMDVADGELVSVHCTCPVEDVTCVLLHQRAPLVSSGAGQVDADEAVVGGFFVGAENTLRALVRHILQQRKDLCKTY